MNILVIRSKMMIGMNIIPAVNITQKQLKAWNKLKLS